MSAWKCGLEIVRYFICITLLQQTAEAAEAAAKARASWVWPTVSHCARCWLNGWCAQAGVPSGLEAGREHNEARPEGQAGLLRGAVGTVSS